MPKCKVPGCEGDAEYFIGSNGELVAASGPAGPHSDERAIEPLKLAILVEQSIQPIPFEKIEASLHVSNITAAHTDEEIEALVARSNFVIHLMAQRVAKTIAQARRDKGWAGQGD